MQQHYSFSAAADRRGRLERNVPEVPTGFSSPIRLKRSLDHSIDDCFLARIDAARLRFPCLVSGMYTRFLGNRKQGVEACD